MNRITINGTTFTTDGDTVIVRGGNVVINGKELGNRILRAEMSCPAEKTGSAVDCGGCEEHFGPALSQAQKNFRADLRKVLDDLEKLLIEKNDAYGDAALNPMRCFARELDSEAQIRVRLDDKLSRIMRGELKFGSDVAAEDVMTDLFGYLALYQIARLRRQRGK